MKHDFNGFDLSRINKITGGNADAVQRFSTLFVEHTVGGDLPKLIRSIKEKDPVEARGLAHRMKSNIDLFSIEGASELIRSIEAKCNEPFHLDAAEADVVQLQHILTDVSRQLLETFS